MMRKSFFLNFNRLYAAWNGYHNDGIFYASFDGSHWSKQDSTGYFGVVPVLNVYQDRLYMVWKRVRDQEIWYAVLGEHWLEMRGDHSYTYLGLNHHDTSSKSVSAHKPVQVPSGAPYLCIALIKNDESTDFPTGAELMIKGPDGKIYNQEADEEKLLVNMSGTSLQYLLVKDPMPGKWLITLTVTDGVEFHFQFTTIPHQDLGKTIEKTVAPILSTKKGGLHKRFFGLDDTVALAVLAFAAIVKVGVEAQSTKDFVPIITSGRVDVHDIPQNITEAAITIFDNLPRTGSTIEQPDRVVETDETRGLQELAPRIFWDTVINGRVRERNRNYGPVYITLQRLSPNRQRNRPDLGPRPIRVAGFIFPVTVGPRTSTPKPSAGFNTGGELDIDNGHLGALQNGFPDVPENIVPQWRRWQRLGDWRKMEQNLNNRTSHEIRNSEGTRSSIYYVVDVEYRDTGTVTPSLVAWSFPRRFRVRAWIRDLNNPIENPDDPNLRSLYIDEAFEGYPDNWNQHDEL